MISEREKRLLEAQLRAAGLERLIEKLDYVAQRLEAFCAEYNRSASVDHGGVIPSTVSVSEFLQQADGNPHRVKMLLQALAFACTPPILAMMWMVEMGADINEVQLSFKRRESLDLVVIVGFGYEEATVTFRSTDIWDLSVFRFVGLVKGDELPIITGMFPTPLHH